MIEIKDLNFGYSRRGRAVFDGFTLSLAGGHIYGLLGKNGTGKSTLLYLIAGLLHPRRGTVRIGGTESRLRRPEILRDVFIVPEEYDLPPVSLDAYIRVNEPFYPNFSREVLGECLKDFELPNFRRLNELSMGQKKKVYVSIALASGCRLILMDEPTNGLDIPSKSDFRRVVAAHFTGDRTMIISTHQVHDIEQLLDHIVIVSAGGLLLDAPVEEICRRWSFGLRAANDMDDSVIYAEPTLQGNAVICRRTEGDNGETPINVELLFDAAVKGALTDDKTNL